MKYIKLTFQYFTVKKLLYYFILAIVPSICLLPLSSDVTLINLAIDFDKIELKSFLDVISLNFRNISPWISVAGLFLAPIFFAMIMGTLDRDMRIGDFRIQNLLRRLNNNYIYSFNYSFLFVLFFIVYKIISSLTYLLWVKILPQQLQVAFIITFALLFSLVFLYLISLFILCAPTSVNTGLRINKAISQSIYNVKGKIFNIFLALLFPNLLRTLLLQFFSLINVPVTIIVEILINMFMVIYILVLMFVAYYDILDYKREDLNKNIKW